MLIEKVYYADVTTTENAPNLESIAMGQPGYVLAMPTFTNVEEERTYRKSRLAGALRIFGRLGFGEGVAGHITVRDPELTDHFWVNPFGLSFRHMRVSDLLLVNHHGEVVHGTMPVNRAAFVIHSAIHSARPEVIAAAHRTNRRLQIIQRTGAGADHPTLSNYPESRYLKVIWSRVL